MTKAPEVPTTAVPTVQRVDPDVAALRRAMETMQQGWWNGQGWPIRPIGKHCVATAIRANEGLLRYFKVMHRLRKELGKSVRIWNDYSGYSQRVIDRLDDIASGWEKC